MGAKKGSEGKGRRLDGSDLYLKPSSEANVPKETVATVPKPKGRPTDFTPELARAICFELSKGKSLRSVAKMDGMPAGSTIWRWLDERPEFQEQYTRAKQEAADALAEEILDISDNTADDILTDDEGRVIPNSVRIQRDRLRVDTRKFLMAKMKPKKYGDKLDLTSDGKALPTPIFGGMSVKGDDEQTNS